MAPIFILTRQPSAKRKQNLTQAFCDWLQGAYLHPCLRSISQVKDIFLKKYHHEAWVVQSIQNRETNIKMTKFGLTL